jgi:hypothetical protein
MLEDKDECFTLISATKYEAAILKKLSYKRKCLKIFFRQSGRNKYGIGVVTL